MTELMAQPIRVLEAILKANEDLEERARMLPVCVSYDPEEDLFTLTLGEVQEAVTESIRNHICLRLDPATMKLVGIEIPDLTTRIYGDSTAASIWRHACAILGPEEKGSTDPEPKSKWAQEVRKLVAQS